MKKIVRKLLACAVVLLVVCSLSQIRAAASPKVYSTTINLDKSDSYETFNMEMPKDGKVKINVQIKDKGTIPGTLTVAIQKSYKEGAPKIKEITGITAESPVTDLEVDLGKGTYYFSYKLSNATGDLTDTQIFLSCTAEILPTVAVNIPELKVSSLNSYEDVTAKGYNELKFGDGKKDTNIVVPFTVKNGSGVYISMAPESAGFDEITGIIYKDKECTKALGKSFSMEWSEESTDYIRTLSGSGTYYIKFTLKNIESEAVGETKFFVKLYDLNGDDRTITLGKPTLAYQDNTGKKINYKVTVKTTSNLTVNVALSDDSNSGAVAFCLLDKNKKAITKSSEVYTRLKEDNSGYDSVEKYYTVSAGTYYIQVNASDNIYQLTSTADKCKSSAAPTKAKAKPLKIMKTTGFGYFTVADSKAKTEWYKLTVDSEQRLQIYMEYIPDGKFDFEVIDSKGKVLYKLSKNPHDDQVTCAIAYTHTFAKGTYYLKTYKREASSSVYYYLQVLDYEYLK